MVLGGLLPGTPAVHGLVIVGATGLIWLASGWLEESAEHLAAYSGLPAVVQGPVVAIGSSVPELASVVFASPTGAFDVGVGGIVGFRRCSTSSSSRRCRASRRRTRWRSARPPTGRR